MISLTLKFDKDDLNSGVLEEPCRVWWSFSCVSQKKKITSSPWKFSAPRLTYQELFTIA